MANQGKHYSKRKRPGQKNHGKNRRRSLFAIKKAHKAKVERARNMAIGKVKRNAMSLFMTGVAVDFLTAFRIAGGGKSLFEVGESAARGVKRTR